MKILHSSPTITEKDIKAVTDVLNSRHLEDGEIVEQFENKLKSYIGRNYAVATANGFSAIHLSLIALGVEENDEVIIPSYTCPALLNPVLIMGAIPVFADIEDNSFNISARQVKKNISEKTKAIIVPHTFGFPADVKAIRNLGYPVIEDCAQSLGGKLNDKKLGTFSEISIFSFYATKMITSGDGGMVLTDNKEIYEKVRNYRYYGHKKNHKFLAYNYHLTNLPAALGLSQLDNLKKWVEERKKLAKIYDHYFEKESGINIDFSNKKQSIYFRYPIQLEKRDQLKEKLKQEDIYTGYGVLEGLHQLQNYPDKNFPNTAKFLKQILSLPLYPSLKESDIEFIAKKVLKIIK
jgi:perosamine synthetase